jgi:MFS family permease
MGWLMDRWGVRFGLAGAVVWWSIATGTQSFTRSGLQLGFTRFWMGTGESGNYSGGIKTIFRIFSPTERTLAIGIRPPLQVRGISGCLLRPQNLKNLKVVPANRPLPPRAQEPARPHL